MGELPDRPERRRGKGFRRAAALVERSVRVAGESRGFAVSRLLTHWTEVAGAALAAHSRPVKISYGKGGFGGTLTLLTTGAHAPVLEMQKEALRARVNACYGYQAIARIAITQTAPSGFAEDAAPFSPAKEPETRGDPTPAERARASHLAEDVGDQDLREALETLGGHILSRSNS